VNAVFDFFDGGAEDEIALRDNRAAWTPGAWARETINCASSSPP
jgi:hypothetical protein